MWRPCVLRRPCSQAASPTKSFARYNSFQPRHSRPHDFHRKPEDRPRKPTHSHDSVGRNLDGYLTTLNPFLPSGEYDARTIAMMKSRGSKRDSAAALTKRQRLQKLQRLSSRVTDGSPREVLALEAHTLLIKHKSQSIVDDEPANAQASEETTDKAKAPLPPHFEVELEIEELSSTGDGLAYSAEHDLVFVVPFSIPGDRILARKYPQVEQEIFTMTDFVQIIRPSPQREGVTPGCQYFGTCSGCQLQMLSYEDQLKHKKTIVEKAFAHFSNLDPTLIPPVQDTIGSPLQYEYRTKLTPHYPGIPSKASQNSADTAPPIGFCKKNSRVVMDIEQCPIATPIINEGLKLERAKVHERTSRREKGATILLRESTRRLNTGQQPAEHALESTATVDETNEQSISAAPPSSPSATETQDPSGSHEEKAVASIALAHAKPTSSELSFNQHGEPRIINTYPTHVDTKTYTSDHRAMATEYVGEFSFRSVANSFFQNNNSILPKFIKHVRDNCTPKSMEEGSPRIKYLLDAYCGSGLFGVSLSPLFSSVLGIDVDANGVEAARLNAKNNGVPNAGFIAADADQLFADVPFPPDQTMVVIDPPRKGASADFLAQLCKFGPRRVVYVSCNVHTQARDVGLLVQGFGSPWRYEIESLRGFDFFPQTGHVEGLCFLDRVPDVPATATAKPDPVTE